VDRELPVREAFLEVAQNRGKSLNYLLIGNHNVSKPANITGAASNLNHSTTGISSKDFRGIYEAKLHKSV